MYEKIKKYWKFIVGFIVSVFAVVFFNNARNKRIERNLNNAREQLRESEDLISRLQGTNNELKVELVYSKNIVSRLKSELENSRDNVEEIDRINAELESESTIFNGAILKLRKFIDENASTE